MAKLKVVGFEGIETSFEKLAPIPNDVTSDMLKAMGKVVEDEIRKSAAQHSIPSGPMIASLYSKDPTIQSDGGKIVTTFKGSRHRGNTDTREAEIAFLQNYGTSHQKSRQFITDVRERNDPAIGQAGEKVLNAYLDKLGL